MQWTDLSGRKDHSIWQVKGGYRFYDTPTSLKLNSRNTKIYKTKV